MTPDPELDRLAADLDVLEAETEIADALEIAALSLEVEIAETEVELEARRSDLAAGRVPEGVTRALFPHEIAARTDFAGIETERRETERAIARRLEDDRGRFVDLLAADLHGLADPLVVARLTALDGPVGIFGVAGAKALVAEARAFHRDALAGLAGQAALRVLTEAEAQGVTDTRKPRLEASQRAEIDAHAVRLAQGPLVDLVRALRERAFRAGAGRG